jgi:hypothetical protein
MKFNVGDKVMKIGGSYQAPGIVVAAFKTNSGEVRYVFEFIYPTGMLHIFNEKQIESI